jgi:hypothetical protein
MFQSPLPVAVRDQDPTLELVDYEDDTDECTLQNDDKQSNKIEKGSMDFEEMGDEWFPIFKANNSAAEQKDYEVSAWRKVRKATGMKDNDRFLNHVYELRNAYLAALGLTIKDKPTAFDVGEAPDNIRQPVWLSRTAYARKVGKNSKRKQPELRVKDSSPPAVNKRPAIFRRLTSANASKKSEFDRIRGSYFMSGVASLIIWPKAK